MHVLAAALELELDDEELEETMDASWMRGRMSSLGTRLSDRVVFAGE